MLTPEERFNAWQEFHSAVHKLFSNVEDALNSKFAPYEFEDGVLVEPDKDTPEVKKLFDMLADLDAFLQKKEESVGAEYSKYLAEQANLQNSFEAWSLGLCPQVMRTLPNKHMNFWWEYWPKIAKLKQTRGISREDTEQAVALWEAECRKAS